MKKSNIILINQVTGPLFIDIANEYAKEYSNVVLITGVIESTYAKINNKINIVYKTRYRRKNAILRISTWLLFFIQVNWFILFNKSKFDKALIVTNPPLMPFVGSYLFSKNNINFEILVYDV